MRERPELSVVLKRSACVDVKMLPIIGGGFISTRSRALMFFPQIQSYLKHLSEFSWPDLHFFYFSAILK